MQASKLSAIFAVFFLAGVLPLQAATLPPPDDVFDGINVSQKYDDFFAYSSQLLTQFGYLGFSGAAGVGQLDVVLGTQAGGIDNDPIAGGFVFEDPMDTPSGASPGSDSFSGTWGAGAQPKGPVLVDDLLAYLHHRGGPDNNIPVFGFDLVEPGAAAFRDMELLAYFSVYDPALDQVIAFWSLDNIDNGVFDPGAFILFPGEFTVTGDSGTEYTAETHGSGKYDWFFYAPTMDLSNYDGLGYEFHAFVAMRNLNGGGEEIFLAGAFSPFEDNPPGGGTGGEGGNVIPEPASLAMLGMGLGAFAYRKRRQQI